MSRRFIAPDRDASMVLVINDYEHEGFGGTRQ